MIVLKILLFVILIRKTCCGDRDFPPGFKFGAATAAYQVEGAWNISGKGESIWDHYTHNHPGNIKDGSNGDVACDSYHKWQEDIDIASRLGLHFYRFSISWPRILPKGYSIEINEDGVKYYNNLIDGLLAKGIEPVVTMYHWDLPQPLQNLGGWTNPLMSDYFAHYAKVLFELYGDRVKTWLTINEPITICDIAYGLGILAPGIFEPKVAPYLCSKHILLAHAKAWRIYDEEFKPKYKGRVSLIMQMFWFEAKTADDEEIAELVRQYGNGRFAHPIYSAAGGWPPSIQKQIAKKSKEQGYSFSRLPSFTEEEIELVRGTYDFLALNHYTSRLVRKPNPDEEVHEWPLRGAPDMDAIVEVGDNFKPTQLYWFYIYPVGFRRVLSWLKREYGDVEIMIMENGLGTKGNNLDDDDRVNYYQDYMEQLLLAIKEDRVNVTAYTAWTLFDNFEWFDGYSSKFGLVQVDFEDPERTRTLRKSAHYYAQVIKHHSLDIPKKYKDEL